MAAIHVPQLYEFQRTGLDNGRALYAGRVPDGVKRRSVVFVGPTGMGKTTLASEAARGRVARGGRVCAIAHRQELVIQMGERMQSFGLDVGFLGLRSSARVQVTSIQTILANRRMPPADFYIFDEAHHYVSDEWSSAPRLALESGALLMGLTATPEREDGRGLGMKVGGIFDGLVVVAQIRDMIELNSTDDRKGVTPIELVNPKSHVRRLAQYPHVAYKEFSDGRYVVVFAPNVEAAHVFSAGFASVDIEAPVIHGEMKKDARARELVRFANGDVRVLVNVAVLTEGWDAPICDGLILSRKVGSLSLLRQMIGRARRARAGKKSAICIDLSGNIDLHGHPDADILYDLESGMHVATSEGLEGPPCRLCRVCKRVLDQDIADAKARGEELAVCPEPGCGTPISRQTVPSPEEIELQRIQRDEQLRRVPENTLTKALATMYYEGLCRNHKRTAAENKFRGTFKRYPDTNTRVIAWRNALEKFATSRGDAWMPPESP